MPQSREIEKTLQREGIIAEALLEYYHNNKETLTREEVSIIQDIMLQNNSRDHAHEIDEDLDKQLQEQKKDSYFHLSEDANL